MAKIRLLIAPKRKFVIKLLLCIPVIYIIASILTFLDTPSKTNQIDEKVHNPVEMNQADALFEINKDLNALPVPEVLQQVQVQSSSSPKKQHEVRSLFLWVLDLKFEFLNIF